MTTQRTLSGGAPPQRVNLAHRESCGLPSCSQHRALSLQILIANPRLEFRLTRRKLSPLRISNREYSAIFVSRFRTCLASRHSLRLRRLKAAEGSPITRHCNFNRRPRLLKSPQPAEKWPDTYFLIGIHTWTLLPVADDQRPACPQSCTLSLPMLLSVPDTPRVIPR